MPLVDVIIAGGGPVGTTLALLSAARGIRPQVIHRPAEAPLSGAAAAALPYRPIALSHASAQLLTGLQGLRMGDVTAIERIHVSQQGRFGRTVMEACDHHIPALGYVVEASQLARTLTSAAGPLSV